MTDMHIGKAANVGHVEIAQQTNNVYDTDVEKDSCLKDLYVTNPSADKKRIERDKGGLLKDCYSWILYNGNFVQWRDDPEQHLLWIKGDPGKGKTMLLAGLITELEKTSHDGIFYFFCQAARPSHRTASNVLRGVIWFLVSKRPGLKSYVRREYDQAGSNIFTDHNAWYALSGILTAILEDETSADCIIIIDALDECTEDREKLIGYISQCSVSCKAKWVISSRNWPEIESQLDATQGQVRLHLELNHASISNAVLKFVDSKVDRLNSTYDRPNRERIRKHLLDNANDTFLWVALVCQELEKPGVKNYHSSSILHHFPAGLNELYERMISDINDRDMDWCRAILAVIAVALRPLSLQELAAADGSLTEWVQDKETLWSLVTSCGSLLTIRGDTVYVVHQSVNDFLRSTPKILHSGIAQQQLSIFLNSIKVMQNMLHRNVYELKDNCALIDDIAVPPAAPLTIAGYACIYWVDHFCEWLLAEDQHRNILCDTMITQFLENKYLYWLEAMSLLRCTSEAIKAMKRLEDKLNGRGFVELRLLVKDAVRFASTHRTIMDTAPLQLYDSALIFTPQLSKIKGCFNQEINKSIDVFSPDFQHWDACLHTIPGITSHDNDLTICEFSPDGGQVATINNTNSLLLMDSSTGGLVKSIESPGGRLQGFTFYPSGHSLVTLSGGYKDEAKLSILHLPNGEYSKSFTIYNRRDSALISVSLDGQLLALASDSHTVDIWNLASETEMDDCYRTCSGYPSAVSVTHDRTRCAVFQDDKELVVYSWESSITVQQIARFHRRKYVFDVSWAADDRSIALCSDFGIELWDLEAMRLVGQARDDRAMKICYGRNRQLALLGYRNGTLKIWSLDTILSHSEPTTQQSASIVKAFFTAPSGKIAVIRSKGELDSLSIAFDGRFHHLPKTLQNSPQRLHYKPVSLAFGHDDYVALATNWNAIYVFNFDHDTGLYCCERRIGEHMGPESIPMTYSTIQFWGQELITSYDNYIHFWDLKTGKYLRRGYIAYGPRNPRSTITADGRIAGGDDDSQVVIWDIMCGKKMQCFDLHVLQLSLRSISNISLDSGGMLAISAQVSDENFIAIGKAEDGTWIRKYSLLNGVPTLTFLTQLRLDTGFGVLEYDKERGSSSDIPTVTAEDHWDPRYLRLSYSKSEAWLMKGSRRILWIPRQDVDPERFSIQTDLETVNSVMSTVEINDAVFCQDHLAEICEDCSVDLREENDAFYGFDSVERDAIESPHASINDDGVYMCKKHDSATCNQCFGWKKKITKARMDAKKAGKH
ncbi:Vegetative incompatibility protein HET-E-1 [Fusarium oxysporum]|nr:Vegetative incompatibility protein HET-E-1 [Fusarium oxysporum]